MNYRDQNNDLVAFFSLTNESSMLKWKGSPPIRESFEEVGALGRDRLVIQDLGGGKNCVPAMKALSGAG